MKKKLSTLLPILLLFLGVNAQTPTVQKVHLAIKSYLLKTLNDPGSYKPVSWGELAKSYNEFNETEAGIDVDSKIIFYADDPAKVDSLKNAREILVKKYKRTFKYYRISHDYRAKNTFNALLLKKDTFTLDGAFNVTNVESLDDLYKKRAELEKQLNDLHHN